MQKIEKASSDPIKSEKALIARRARAELARRELARRLFRHFIKYNFDSYLFNWHNELLIDKLQQVADGTCKRLIVMMPPRSGKSELCSIQFPAWFLGKFPTKSIVETSYSSELSLDFGRQTRNIFADKRFGNVFDGIKLAEDSTAKGKWNTNQGGSYFAVGVGGSLTGRGADCVIPYCTVVSDHGIVPISKIRVGDNVYGYDHATGKRKWARVIATQAKRTIKPIVRIGRLLCTSDHLIYKPGDGYIEAYAFSGVPMWEEEGNARLSLSSVPQSVGAAFGKTSMLPLWNRIRAVTVGARQKLYGGVLLWEGLLQRISQDSATGQDRSGNVQVMWSEDRWQEVSSVLQRGLLQRTSKIVAGHRGIFWRFLVFACESLSPRYFLPTLWKKTCQDARAPHKSQPRGKHDREFNPSMSAVSYALSRDVGVCADDLACLLTGEGQYVVDIQTDTENFFCEGLLVHNCLLIDDPIKNRQDADSQVIRDNIWSWYRSTARTRLSPDGAVVIVLTRWHEDDLVGRLLAGDTGDKWEVIKMKAIAEHDEPPYRKAGEVLWPGRFSLENLMETKAEMGTYEFSALYQQEPLGSELQEFKKDWFKTVAGYEVDRLNTRCYVTIDTAVSQKDSADYTAITINRVSRENKWYIISKRIRINPTELVDMLFQIYAQYRPEKIGIEKTTYSMAIRPFLDQEMRKRGKRLPIVELEHHNTKKETRIRALIPLYESGQVFHVDGECFDLEKELLSFPQSNWDDASDSLAYQVQVADAMPYMVDEPVYEYEVFDRFSAI